MRIVEKIGTEVGDAKSFKRERSAKEGHLDSVLGGGRKRSVEDLSAAPLKNFPDILPAGKTGTERPSQKGDRRPRAGGCPGSLPTR